MKKLTTKFGLILMTSLIIGLTGCENPTNNEEENTIDPTTVVYIKTWYVRDDPHEGAFTFVYTCDNPWNETRPITKLDEHFWTHRARPDNFNIIEGREEDYYFTFCKGIITYTSNNLPEVSIS